MQAEPVALPILHVVVPCYDPPDRWQFRFHQRMRELGAALPQAHIRIVLVNDGSTRNLDAGSVEQAVHDFSDALVIAHPVNRGKGAALRTGVAACPSGSLCLFTDVDIPYTVESMRAVAMQLLDGSDVVLGHRNTRYYEHVPRVRRWISLWFRSLLKHVLRLRINDTQCGLKAFNGVGRELFLSTAIERFLFDLEFVVLVSRRAELKVAQVDVELDEGVRFTRLNAGVLLGELGNFLRVALRR